MNFDLTEIEKLIPTAMTRDQFQFRNRLKRIRNSKQHEHETPHSWQALAVDIQHSVDLRTRRAEKLPAPEVDPGLPIFQRQAEICEAILHNQVVVVSGATGSGKSTQIPLLALRCGYGAAGLIGHTQPRRIAARSVANRIAQQMGSTNGSEVAYKIRFADQTSAQTYVKLMTDGILLAETQSDRFLEQYDLIIVDEAHERSLNIDFLLGYLKRVLEKRPELRLVITSATIDTERFAEHFATPNSSVPVIDVEGRTYPVEIRYQPQEDTSAGNPTRELEDHIVGTCRELAGIGDGDMLVFLPTENDIRTIHKKLRSLRLPGPPIEILPLYARLSTAQQNQIFVPGARKRIVLATNVAESSITVPRVRFVVDVGTARISHYSPRSKVQRLPIQPISQASADQRAGRCGRIGPGTCVRLYSQEDYETRPRFTTPEIRRTNLSSVILQTLALKLGKIEAFPFLDPPRPEAIRDGFKTLFELGAVDHHRRLTSLGRKLSRLPVDPRIGRMLFAADDENCLAEVLIIASGLEIQDPRVRPAEKKKAADAQHEKFLHEKSDFLTLLNIWDFFHRLKEDLSRSKLKLACEQNFLSFALMRQWQDIHRQLRAMIMEQKLTVRRRQNDEEAIHRSLLAGLLSGIALLGDRHEYTGAGGIKFHLWPGSGIFAGKPKWIVAAEIVETSRRFGRTIAKISPEWIEPLAQHLVKSRYSDAHWSKKRQAVMASEHVSLWGIPIVSGRAVNYGRVDQDVARSIFVEQGLAEGQLEGNFPFLQHNQWLVNQIQTEVAKTRCRDLIVDFRALETFYLDRLPADIFDKVSLAQRLKNSDELDASLRMTRSDLLPETELSDSSSMFPDEVKIGSMNVPVQYRFSPGDSEDGATVRLPLEGVGQLDDAQAGWLVPGLLESRVVALIRSLPKSIRRNLVPAPETAKQVVKEIEFGKGNFFVAVAAQLSRFSEQPIRADQFATEKLDDYLKVNMQVVNEAGEVVAQGRNVAEIRQQLGAEYTSSIVDVEDKTWNQDGLLEWSWGDFPAEITISRGGTQLAAFPTIVDQQSGVGLRLADSPAASDQQTRQGLMRLFQFINRKHIKSQVNWLPELDRHSLVLAQFVATADIRTQLGDLVARVAFTEQQKIPRNESEFQERQAKAVERIGIATQEVANWLPKLATELHQVQIALGDLSANFAAAKEDLTGQLATLTPVNFLVDTPWNWLKQYPRFLQAMNYRMEKLSSTDPSKDRSQSELIEVWWTRWQEADQHLKTQAIVDPELAQLRWMIEEFRVSLFAQPLGTSLKVSETRLEKQLDKVQR